MLLTGKYYPDEDIKLDEEILFFCHYKEQSLIYSENSEGYWTKREYNDNRQLIYRETSKYGVLLDER